MIYRLLQLLLIFRSLDTVLPLRSTSPASRSKITRDLQDAKPASSSVESAEEPRLRQAAHMVLLLLLRRLDMIRRNILSPVLVKLLYCTCLCRTKSPKSKLGKEDSALKEPARTLGIALKDLLCMCSSFLLLYLVCFCLSVEWLKRCFHLNILEFAGQGQLNRVWCCTLHWPGLVYARIVFQEQQPFCHLLQDKG